MSPDRAVCMAHRHDGVAAETVLVAWDPARRVLWRKAPGTYLADHVERFVVDYFSADGRRLEAADFAAAGWPRAVARIAVTVEVTVGGHTAWASRTVALTPEAT
jgi:cobalamin biosynthesis protein CobT